MTTVGFRPLSGNRENQLKEDIIEAEIIESFRPLSGNRENQLRTDAT